ncbi:SpvB/TcaC N-terminal domain-containing protein [Nannocystis bainbridge]|uniref:SpvB/TcaC N-terminal domain-containing protein n=1 Tax=Nannocystis bainbridge TaxID=2995303 RepID=A0ABT5DUQ2_9BACT|nr:SpvB/TcaC N-terminal domain-containing protein [Nannocystis bainbridge]MDC0716131.1 SpvB/TcaC N-terminal domain-containing protein [Nannocystis bainbridge]
MRASLSSLIGVLALGAWLAPTLVHADTSATLATAINLPKGPATIEGHGQGYDVSAASGLPSIRYALEVPPGRAGLEPQIALQYDAGSGSGPVGLGWSLEQPAIERSLHGGLPRYDGTDRWKLRGLGGGEDLVEVEDGVYRERIEQGTPVVVRALAGGAMSAVTTDGTGYLFGIEPEARLEENGNVYRLELSAVTDPHGNRLDFEYVRLEGSPPLLAAIRYDDGRAVVRLEYEARPDIVRSRAPGFTTELRHRLRTIATEFDGAVLRTTTLDYSSDAWIPSSRLITIRTVASDGAALPSWHLDYTGAADEARVAVFAGAPALDPTADGRAWVDIDGDALPDLLDASPGAWRYRKGRGDSLAATWTDIPSPALALTKSARFADLTGDGIEDLLAQPNADEVWAYTTTSGAPFGEVTPITLDVSFELADPQVAVVDLNLDGRIDVLRHDDADGWIWLRHRDQPGYLEAEAVPPPPAGMRLGDPGVQLADMDGDRIPELVRVMQSESRVLVAGGEGRGFFADPVELAGVPAMIEHERWELSDVNSDGAADLVRLGAALEVHVNQLDGSFAQALTKTWPEVQADEVLILSDVDANGTIDVLRIDTDGSDPWRVCSIGARPGLLAGVRTALGYSHAFTYTTAAALALADADAGASWSFTPPAATPVLAKSREADAHTPWTRAAAHHVRDGWYDPARGEFRGFAELRIERPGDAFTEASTEVARYDLGQDDEARKLQLVTSETRSPRGVLVRDEHELEIDAPAPGVRAVRRRATDTYHVEAGPEAAAARTRTEWDFDAWGNLLEERALGRVDRTTGVDVPGDERITTHAYATAESADAPRDRIAEIVVAEADGTQVSATRTYYDGPEERGMPLGQLGARGVVSRVETWLAGDTWIPTLRQRVDAHGNVTRIRDGEDGTLERRYDTSGLYPLEERLLLASEEALTTRATWDPAIGHPTQVVAPNGAARSFEYDRLGRLVADVEHGDSAELPTRRYHYFLAGDAGAPAVVTELRKHRGAPEIETSIQHLDGLGRSLARVTADDAGVAAIVAEAIVYTAEGEVAEQFTPHAVPASSLTPGQPPTPATDWPRARHAYDALGRVTHTRDADGRDTATAYGPLRSELREHEDLHPEPPYADTPERRLQDGLGRTTLLESHRVDRIIRDRYGFDAAGGVVSHTDPAGHESRYTYDGAGRLTAIDSPDAGHIVQRYDDAGRLIERVTATGARVRWSHDRAGRLVHELALTPEGKAARESTRTYDGPGPWERGYLSRVDDDAGHLEIGHDARGNVNLQTRRFAAHAGPVTLTVRTDHDAQNRPLREEYPDGSGFERQYTARGLEAPLAGWIDGAVLDAAGRWTRIDLANGVTRTRELDHAGRQLGERVITDVATLRALTHAYDAAGLLGETRDLVGPTPHSPSLDARYQYDDQHRLVRAEEAGKVQAFAYTDDGNLSSFAGAAFTYDRSHPHAVADAHGQHLAYDDAGRLTRVAGDGPLPPGTWRWDPLDHLASFVAEDGQRTEHVYDHAGREAIRREYTAAGALAHETLYLTPAIEVRDGRLVRWITWGGERIAEAPAKLPRGGYRPAAAALLVALVLFVVGLARSRPQLGRLAAVLALVLGAQSCRHEPGAASLLPDTQTRWHVADRLGSAALILDHRGEVVARDANTAYGAPHTAWREGQAAGPIYRFTDKEDLALAGAVTIGARHYLPALGRWATPDPRFLYEPGADLDNAGERNLYRYAANNPVANVDPDGHSFWSKLAKAGRSIAKGGNGLDAFMGIVDDAWTVVNPASSWVDRGVALVSLASEALPVSAGDAKDAYRYVRGADNVADAVKRVERRDYGEAAKAIEKYTKPVEIPLSRSRFPGSAAHTSDAQRAGHPMELTIDRSGARPNRSEALRGHAPVKGMDRDEYPPAFTREGGTGASVRPVAPGDNRGAGACIGAACRGLPNGTKIKIKVTE